MTAGTEEKAAERPWQLSAEALALWEKFPPRQVPGGWPATRQPRGKVVARLLEPPFLPASSGTRSRRKLALLKILDWLELHPGRTWQERWNAAGIAPGGWRDVITGQLSAAGLAPLRSGQLDEIPGPGIARLAAADVIRPGLEWLLLASPPPRLAGEMALVRDPEGISRLRELSAAGKVDIRSAGASVERAALIMAAKGGMVADITVGDCLELARASREAFPQQWSPRQRSPFFYQVLHAAGAFPASAPPTVRIFSSHFTGQLTVEQMIDRYDLACRPVRDLLVDYLRERQAGIDYATLSRLALTLGLWFWKDLETHHPGISSLRLPPDIAAAWKQRVRLKNARAGAAEERKSASGALMTVRASGLLT